MESREGFFWRGRQRKVQGTVLRKVDELCQFVLFVCVCVCVCERERERERERQRERERCVHVCVYLYLYLCMYMVFFPLSTLL